MTVEELLKKLADAPKDATVRLSTYSDTERVREVHIAPLSVVIEGEGVDEADEDEWCDDCGELIDDCEYEDESDLPHDEPDEEDESEPA